MRTRWLLVVGLGVSVSALALVSRLRITEPTTSIAAEPERTSGTPRSSDGEAASAEARAGLALPLPADPIAQPRRRTRPQPETTLAIDPVEPWTGEDLTPVLVAAKQHRRGLDKVDPWDPTLVHSPATRDSELDDQDPWAANSLPRRPRALPKAKLALEKISPWEPSSETPAAVPSADML
jgi:hypothetical protein